MRYILESTLELITRESAERRIDEIDAILESEAKGYSRLATFFPYVLVVAEDETIRRIKIEGGQIVEDQAHDVPTLTEEKLAEGTMDKAKAAVQAMLRGEDVDLSTLNPNHVKVEAFLWSDAHRAISEGTTRISNVMNPSWAFLVGEQSRIGKRYTAEPSAAVVSDLLGLMAQLEGYVGIAQDLVIKRTEESIAPVFAKEVGTLVRKLKVSYLKDPENVGECAKAFDALADKWYDLNLTGQYLKRLAGS